MNDARSILEQLCSCGVSDVLDAVGERARLVTGLRPVTAARVAAGRASTVQLAPLLPGEGRPDRHLGAAAVDAGDEETVIMIAVAGDASISGAWGGLLSLAAHTRGVRGTVVAGLCRDTDEIRGLGYPVYAHGSTPTTARGRLKEVACGATVTVSGVTIEPGDYVVADSDGLVVVPASKMGLVAEAGARMLAVESHFADRIRSGEPLTSVLGSYESMAERSGTSHG